MNPADTLKQVYSATTPNIPVLYTMIDGWIAEMGLDKG
jgi:hypothetical protein